MGSQLVEPRRLDISGLPNVIFGHRTILWWATMGLALVEGSFFVMLVVAYFFLRGRVVDWPPGVLPPYHLWATINTILFAVSLVPNHLAKKAAVAGNLRKLQKLLVVLAAFGLATLLVRIWEFPSLNVGWNSNAYGSLVWGILVFHTAHLLTDWVDTLVLTALMHTKYVEGKRFMDCYENSDYWYFVVLLWIPVYIVVYWVPYWI